MSDTYGAVDLSAISDAAIVDVTQANFEEEMNLSQSVPVVLLFYPAQDLGSQQVLTVLEASARKHAGAFQLGKVNVDAVPELAAALQIKSLPTSIALVARRPVPLFEGPVTPEQFEALITELLQVAPQLGVTGRIENTNPAHEAPRAAEMQDDWEGAVALWKKVLANNPSDREAKQALARAEFQVRLAHEDESELARADRLFAQGDEAAAYNLLLGLVAGEQREPARARLVELLNLGSDPAVVKQARSRLATMLMV
ncbi:tetratricopeptide repeat protein [Scrofimicrobium sp. R131]|uniref:Tetratricopeptide repeat protein n=1 Tax=Scrofimicrobium appendicitidis TaxID=3079930 RepID=A0AAU7VA64_9ACTO